MLHDVLRHGVLSGHPGRYRVRQADAMQPETLARDLLFRNVKGNSVAEKQGQAVPPEKQG
jgi:hypothetical protein